MKYLISFIIRFFPRPFLQRISHITLQFIQVFYLGSRVVCPVCGHRYRKFLPYGRKPARQNALCPHCLSLERHRLLWLYLQDRTGFFREPLDFLHIAPEHCFIHRFGQLNNLDYVTADLESPLAQVKMDIREMPFEDNRFDAVMCNHVMEHIVEDLQAMREIYRVLKPGGWAIIQVPFMGKDLVHTYENPDVRNARDRERIYGQRDHVRIYGKDYPGRLRKAGFRVREDSYVRELEREKVILHALPADEIIYLCTKT